MFCVHTELSKRFNRSKIFEHFDRSVAGLGRQRQQVCLATQPRHGGASSSWDAIDLTIVWQVLHHAAQECLEPGGTEEAIVGSCCLWVLSDPLSANKRSFTSHGN